MKNNLNNLLEKYLETKSIKLKEHTIYNISHNLNKYFINYFKDMNINSLTPEIINEYYIYIGNLELKPQSINLIITHILGFIEWLDIMEYIKPNILRKFKQIFYKFRRFIKTAG